MSQTDPYKPLILISNDDGIEAPGVHRLIDYLTDIADIVCMCPDGPRSGQSMALTVSAALRIKELPPYMGARMYCTNGTPADCVKLAMHTVLDRRPDLVVAGINHGSNAAINVVYSGTMGAAMEGCAFGIPSVGFSLTDHSMDADFEPCRPFVRGIVREILKKGLPEGVCLNVNIPDSETPPSEMRMTRACRGNWSDEYVPYMDPHGHPFYMLAGHFHNEEPDATDTDQWMLAHGIVSVVPVALERTATMPKDFLDMRADKD
jgi:5'-nucleotidase